MDSELRGMVMSYRVTELQALLGFAGKNKTGRKHELQARALDLVKAKSPPITMKIKELHRSIQMSNYGGGSHSSSLGQTASSMVSTSKLGSASSYGNSSYSSDTKLIQDTSSNSFGRSVGYQRVIGGDGQYRTVPICPDIKMKELPFYDIMAVLLRPTSLLSQGQSPKQETQQSFCLSPSQAGDITSSREVVQNENIGGTKVQYQVQVQLRFCALDSTEEQDDLFPQGLVVKVNGRVVQLPTPIPSNRPGVEPKRPSKPLNITSNVKCCPLSTNVIHVSWIADPQRSYCMLINMVKKLTAEQLFGRLKAKRIQPADFTRGRIKEITTAEEEDLCAPTSIRVSVACPLGKSRMSYPCRSTACKHLQCFDANLFLLMNERKPSFVCPVCNKHLKFGDLCIDGYFMDVIKNLSIDSGNDIELHADGSWVPAIKIKSEVDDVGPPSKRMKKDPVPPKAPAEGGMNETIDLDDDIAILDDDEDEDVKNVAGVSFSNSQSNSAPAAGEPEIIDLIDSSDDEDDVTNHSAGSGRANSHEQQDENAQSDASTHRCEQGEKDDSDDEEIGIRPRRRNAKVSYVEESSSDTASTNDGDAPAAPVTSRRPRSPACIELSDSGSPTPSPESLRRPFASVGSGSASTNQASSSANNNRSGSGSSSTIYTSSTMGTVTDRSVVTPTAAAAAGATVGSSPISLQNMHPYQYHHQSPYYSASNTYSVSSTLSASSTPSPTVHHTGSSTTSSAFFPPNMSVPGYTAYDGRASVHPSTMSTTTTVSSIPSWEDDLNSFICSPQALGYPGTATGSTLSNSSFIDDFLNVAAAASGHHPFSSSTSSLYNPHSGGSGGGSRGGGMSGYAGGWI